ncbi:N-methyl-L-tryptophan oxidase [Metabacillus litoralis]|uniref:N-methyl-L-tryptophan oxidase n=1 Tax=Metabacillus litoralis TaxID=152268 RepID=A0A5C6VX52_9BACI|nr:N-methyl-L-tryptophan oxidase [Metabacillus litoralis]TXC89570.1 N-methyl-L-tryptophan oxidase [Metabacillus litoralis]
MNKESFFDVAIIGAGTMGMSAGAFLAEKQVKTLLIDSFDPPHHKGSHHGDTRMIRHAYGEGRQYVTLVKRAQQLWEELEKQTGYKIFKKTGVLGLGPRDSAFLKETMNAAKKYHLPLQLLNSDEIHARWPGFSVPEHFIGCFESESGFIYSENAIKAYKEIAIKNGAELVMNTPVQQINMANTDAVKIITKNNVFWARKVIVTVGAWAAKLLPDLNLPIKPTRKAFGWFETPADLYDAGHFPSFYLEDKEHTCYGFPNIDGTGLKIGRSDGGQEIDPNQHTQNFGQNDADEKELRYFLKNYLPEANGTLTKGKTCLYTISKDNDFIIDHHPENNHVIIACGFSGHGFKFGSVMGEVLSQLAIKGESHIDISLFSLKRFGF